MAGRRGDGGARARVKHLLHVNALHVPVLLHQLAHLPLLGPARSRAAAAAVGHEAGGVRPCMGPCTAPRKRPRLTRPTHGLGWSHAGRCRAGGRQRRGATREGPDGPHEHGPAPPAHALIRKVAHVDGAVGGRHGAVCCLLRARMRVRRATRPPRARTDGCTANVAAGWLMAASHSSWADGAGARTRAHTRTCPPAPRPPALHAPSSAARPRILLAKCMCGSPQRRHAPAAL